MIPRTKTDGRQTMRYATVHNSILSNSLERGGGVCVSRKEASPIMVSYHHTVFDVKKKSIHVHALCNL